MPVKRCVLKGGSIGSLQDLYDEVSRQLSFPRHFGRNLDALWDVLSTDIEGPLELVWEESEASRATMGHDFDRVKDLLARLERERVDVKVSLR